MDSFDINNFDPTTQKIMDFVSEYRWLTIANDWLDVVKLAKKTLQGQRVFITKTLKADRDKAIKYQKDNIAKEKELVAIITEVEEPLDNEILAMELKEEMDKRKESLPIRLEELETIWLKWQYTEEFILSMDFKQFMDFMNTEKARLYEEEMEKKRQAEAETKRLADLKEAEERGRIAAEKKAKEEYEQKESDRLNKEAQEKAKQEQKEIQDKLDKERLAQKIKEDENRAQKAERYKARLEINWYDESDKDEWLISKEETKVILYKKISEFII